MTREFSTDDIFLHHAFTGLVGDSGHDSLAWVLSRPNRQDDAYDSRIWSLHGSRAGGPEPLTSPGFDAASPCWDARGERLAFLSRRDGRSRQVHLIDRAGGEARQVGNVSRELQALLAWSPDGAQLLALVKGEFNEEDGAGTSEADPRVVNFLPWKRDGEPTTVSRRIGLMAIDIKSGRDRMLAWGDFDVRGAQWSPDGRQLAWLRTAPGRQRHRVELWLAEADGGNARRIPHPLSTLQGMQWAPDGATLAFGGSRREGDSLTRLWLCDIASGRFRLAARNLELEGASLCWHPDGDRIAAVCSHRGLFRIAVVDVATRRLRRFRAGLSQVLALTHWGSRLACVRVSLRHGCELYSFDWDGDGPHRHTAFNRWYRQRLRPLVRKRHFEVPDGDGGTERVEAWVLRPPQGDGPHPVLLDFHGGPQSVTQIDYPHHSYWPVLVNRGWVIVAANTVGSGSHGAGFARRLRGAWGGLDWPQQLAILDQLQAEGLVDERVACTGKSYGGYLAAWALTRSPRVRAAIVCAPVTDIESHAGTSDTGYYVTPYAMGGELPELRDACRALSPAMQSVTGVCAATLFLQGEQDQRCPLGQAEQLFALLVRHCPAPCRLVVYPKASHGLSNAGRPSHRVDYHRRVADWACEHVQRGQD